MKSILKLFLYLIVFILALFVFLPKEGAYNLLEKELAKNKIVISDEKRVNKPLVFKIEDSKLYYDGIEVANTSEVSFFSALFFTKLEVNNVKLLDSFKTFAPSPITNITIQHSIMKFDKVEISANGLFGSLNGEVDLLNQKIFIELNASSKMKNSYSKLLLNMRRENGRYIYEYKY